VRTNSTRVLTPASRCNTAGGQKGEGGRLSGRNASRRPSTGVCIAVKGGASPSAAHRRKAQLGAQSSARPRGHAAVGHGGGGAPRRGRRPALRLSKGQPAEFHARAVPQSGCAHCHSPCCAACRAPALCRAGTLLRLPQVRAASGAPCAWAEAWVWYCPTCGQPARPRGDSGRLRRPRRLQGGHQRARLLPARGRRGAAVRAVPVAGDQVAPAAPRRVCGRAVVLDAHVPAQRAAARLGWRP